MIGKHIVWWILTMACVAWYIIITIYVAIKGASDIKEMLTRLAGKVDSSSDDRA